MPTNFEFLKEDYPDLFDWAHDMEKKKLNKTLMELLIQVLNFLKEF